MFWDNLGFLLCFGGELGRFGMFWDVLGKFGFLEGSFGTFFDVF